MKLRMHYQNRKELDLFEIGKPIDSLYARIKLAPRSAHPLNLFDYLEGNRLVQPSKEPSMMDEQVKMSLVRDNFDKDMINDYRIVKVLGRGSFGEVLLVLKEETEYAMKKVSLLSLRKKSLLKRQRSKQTSPIEREIAIMKKLKHQNVERLFEVIEDREESNFFLILQYFKDGSFLSHHHKRERHYEFIQNHATLSLSEGYARHYFRQLFSGLDYLHNFAKIVHRDIKPDNVMIDNDRVAFVDFGISQMTKGKQSSNSSGTAYYMAPERFKQGFYDPFANDMWAMGVMLFQAVSGEKPFEASNLLELQAKIQIEQPKLKQELSLELRDLLQGLLEKNPEKRLKAAEVLRHDWITELGERECEKDWVGQLFVTQKEVKEALSQMEILTSLAQFINIF